MTTRRGFVTTVSAATLYAQTTPTNPLFEAAAAGDLKRATEILDAHPESARDRAADGRTALHIAAAAGKAEMVMFLVGRGAELSAGPETPLVLAVDFPDHEAALSMAQILIVNASDPQARSRDGRTVMEIAKARGHDQIVALLNSRAQNWYGRRYVGDAQGRPVKRDDLNGLPWVKVNKFVSLSHGVFDQVKQMMADEPGLLNTRASWDEIPVEAASHTGQTPIAEWLAERGAIVSTCTATLLGLPERVKASIAADKRCVRERGAHDIAILAYTAYGKQHTEIAQMLLDAGADVHGRALGLTTLHIAASKGYIELGSLLIERGADVNLAVKTNGAMATPLDLAIKRKQEAMEKFLREHGARQA